MSTVNVVEAPTIHFDMEVDGNRDIYSATLYGLNLRRLTTDPAADVHPTSLGSTVVFSSHRDGNAELYSLPGGLPGGDTRLTFTPANETEPELAPNGSSLVYVRDDGGTSRLWLSKANVEGAALLTNAPAGVSEGGPRWWQTSDNILFHSRPSTGVATLYRIAPVAGSTPLAYARSAGGDSAYREPEPVELTSASSAVGAFLFVAADAAGKSRIHLGSVDYVGTARLGYAPVTPAGMLAGEPRFVSGRVVYTIYEPDGSTSLAWVTMPGGSLHTRIPLPGRNPRHPSGRP